ncbi:hypothetical protein Kp7_13 [Klebsiella phage Kp7]|jgi:hypothetical protein|uniref:Uncharacterized protein n=4 Tax=Gansuvirus TaxID=3424934 RepID=A0AAE9HQC6_9CAUD|nr:hypothetical protein vBKpPFBKp16_018 [Klebsiella phage vB_KpP_FBKp16]UQK57853.1 hypothetical protein Kp7_13 [Klebsiella phage Kp7]UVX31888.1 hypothetical protein A2a_00034 [Klebsiella phage VLCpiA2a]UVX31914.1 hypothetical protein A2a_b_00007 [Klebsiella phage VLCpiA2a]UVX32006.1 hypothetical protein A2b_00046 [Klebsiella phage VLCpiA2b]
MRIEWDSDWDYYDRFQGKKRPFNEEFDDYDN